MFLIKNELNVNALLPYNEFLLEKNLRVILGVILVGTTGNQNQSPSFWVGLEFDNMEGFPYLVVHSS